MANVIVEMEALDKGICQANRSQYCAVSRLKGWFRA